MFQINHIQKVEKPNIFTGFMKNLIHFYFHLLLNIISGKWACAVMKDLDGRCFNLRHLNITFDRCLKNRFNHKENEYFYFHVFFLSCIYGNSIKQNMDKKLSMVRLCLFGIFNTLHYSSMFCFIIEL